MNATNYTGLRMEAEAAATEREREIDARLVRRCSRCSHQAVCEFAQIEASRAAVARFLGMTATPGKIAQQCGSFQINRPI